MRSLSVLKSGKRGASQRQAVACSILARLALAAAASSAAARRSAAAWRAPSHCWDIATLLIRQRLYSLECGRGGADLANDAALDQSGHRIQVCDVIRWSKHLRRAVLGLECPKVRASRPGECRGLCVVVLLVESVTLHIVDERVLGHDDRDGEL